MTKQVLSKLFLCAGLFALGTIPQRAEAQLENWYSCHNPDWLASVGYSHLMVPGPDTGAYRGEGTWCNILDIDYQSSLNRACYLQWQFPENVWRIVTVTTPVTFGGLPCASGGSSTGSAAPGGAGPAPAGIGGGSAGTGSAAGGLTGGTAAPALGMTFESSPSRYGEINFQEGWYGDRTKTIIHEATYFDRARGVWIVEGRWGRTNSDNNGRFEFHFTGPCSFEGYWWYSGDKKPSSVNWSGTCK